MVEFWGYARRHGWNSSSPPVVHIFGGIMEGKRDQHSHHCGSRDSNKDFVTSLGAHRYYSAFLCRCALCQSWGKKGSI